MATHQAWKPLGEWLSDIGDLRQWAAEQGYRNLMPDGLIKAVCGETTIEEVMRVAGTSVAEEEGAEI